MIEECAIAALTLLLTGVGIGFLVVISLGIRREEAALSVTSRTPDHVANGVRAINGLTSRRPGIIKEVSLYRQDLRPVGERESEAA